MAELNALSSESDSDEILQGNVDYDMEEMPGNQLLPCTHTNNRSASTAFVVRQNFTDYFNTVGSIPWQADSVSRGKLTQIVSPMYLKSFLHRLHSE
jgi:hypothetical protein